MEGKAHPASWIEPCLLGMSRAVLKAFGRKRRMSAGGAWWVHALPGTMNRYPAFRSRWNSSGFSPVVSRLSKPPTASKALRRLRQHVVVAALDPYRSSGGLDSSDSSRIGNSQRGTSKATGAGRRCWMPAGSWMSRRPRCPALHLPDHTLEHSLLAELGVVVQEQDEVASAARHAELRARPAGRTPTTTTCRSRTVWRMTVARVRSTSVSEGIQQSARE